MANNRVSQLWKNRVDAGLIVLRLGAGLSLFIFFGSTKLKDAATFAHAGHSWSFVDFNRRVGLPAPVIVACYQTLNESLGAVLVACGFLSPLAAASLALGFTGATYLCAKSGESATFIAGVYCLIFLTLALTGPGKYSIDGSLALLKARKTVRLSGKSSA
jgi:uncharacterized membrane protein YphA (DoxX/SURF4 family)